MKTLTFDIICSLLLGIECGARREILIECFETLVKGLWSIPINFPFTVYNRGLQATTRIRNIVIDLMREKRVELERKGASISHQDLITCLLSIGQKSNKEGMSEDEIVHNVVTIMIAGHDTSSVLLTFIIRLLANDPTICASVVQGMIYSFRKLVSFGNLNQSNSAITFKKNWSFIQSFENQIHFLVKNRYGQ